MFLLPTVCRFVNNNNNYYYYYYYYYYYHYNYNNNDDDLEVAHPQSGSSSTWFLVELEFGNVVVVVVFFLLFFFWGEGKTRVPGEKPLRTKERNQKQIQPTYGVEAGIWTRATLVRGERSHHCAIPCSLNNNLIILMLIPGSGKLFLSGQLMLNWLTEIDFF